MQHYRPIFVSSCTSQSARALHSLLSDLGMVVGVVKPNNPKKKMKFVLIDKWGNTRRVVTEFERTYYDLVDLFDWFFNKNDRAWRKLDKMDMDLLDRDIQARQEASIDNPGEVLAEMQDGWKRLGFPA